MLAELAELLRASIDSTAAHEVTLREEMRFIERYVAIQKVRFGERLDVHIAVEDDALDALVPALVLQPLVENAIEHGIAARRSGGRLEIHAAVTDGTLVLRVADDGVGLDVAALAADSARVGLRNTRARLTHMYGTAGRLELVPRVDGGVAALVRIPLRAVHQVTA
jgi:sensor histidine kinase YesM